MTDKAVEIDQKIRVISPEPGALAVFLRRESDTDDIPCKCCSDSCASEMTITVTFCGMTVTETLPIPGILNQGLVNLPDGSYLIVSAAIGCVACGWAVSVGVCAYCDATGEAASDGFDALVPFADQPQDGRFYCPESGAVDLKCFGAQFGVPCKTNPVVTIS